MVYECGFQCSYNVLFLDLGLVKRMLWSWKFPKQCPYWYFSDCASYINKKLEKVDPNLLTWAMLAPLISWYMPTNNYKVIWFFWPQNISHFHFYSPDLKSAFLESWFFVETKIWALSMVIATGVSLPLDSFNGWKELQHTHTHTHSWWIF